MFRFPIQRYFHWILLTLLLSGIAACAPANQARRVMPRAVNGMLDLRGWNFAQDGPVRLAGEWDFYWDRLLTNADFADTTPHSDGLLTLPGSWRGHELNGARLPGQGYATVRLRILLPSTDQPWAVTGPYLLLSAQSLTISGGPLGANSAADSSAQAASTNDSFPATFLPVGDSLQLVVQISSPYHYEGGLSEALSFGTQEQIFRQQQRRTGLEIFLFGAILLMGLYHLGLFGLRPKDRSPLYFGLLCFFMAGRLLFSNPYRFLNLFTDLNWIASVRLSFLLPCIGLILFVQFTYSVFPRYFPRPNLRWLHGIGIAFVLLFALMPIQIVTRVLPPFTLFLLFTHFYLLWVISRAMRRHEVGAGIVFLGQLIFTVTAINDILDITLVIQTGQYSPIGLLLIIVAQAYLLSIRFSDSFTQTEVLSDELGRSEAKYRSLFEDSKDVIFIAGADGQIEEINPACEEMFGYTQAEALLMNALDFFAPHQDRQAFQAALERDESLVDFELEMNRKDGSHIDCTVTVAARRDRDGTITGYRGILHDITTFKQAEAERRHTLTLQTEKETAEAANQAKSAFLANISHELRTPLNAIIGFSRLLANSTQSSADERTNLGIITRSGQHLLTLINQVLDLSKIETGRLALSLAPTDIPALLTELEGMLRLQAARKGLDVRVQWPPDLPSFVQADELKLRQVLINLLNNGIKFTQAGGVLLNLRREYPADSESAALHFSVTDTGPGIPADDQQRLFEPFTQSNDSKNNREGVGLGLAISQRLVELMGGSLTVESPVPAAERLWPGQGGLGSRFSFSLPVVMEEPSSAFNKETIASKPGVGERRIVGIAPGQPIHRLLIVDDSWENRQLLVQLFAPLAFDLRQAENGQQALEIWPDFQPHLILMDMKMPVLDGYQATQQMRQMVEDAGLPQPKIIALTASSFEQDRAGILAAGCDDTLNKPFLEFDLFRLIGQYLDIQFVYSSDAPIGETVGQPTQLTAVELAELPAALRRRLVEAVRLADVQHIDGLLTEMGEDWPQQAEALRPYFADYRYDMLLRLLEESARG